MGLGFMLMGENTHEVTWAMKNRLDEIKATLPPNVEVQTVYDRTELVDHVINTVKNNLFEGGLLVIAVLFAFWGTAGGTDSAWPFLVDALCLPGCCGSSPPAC
jgi:cobalt-zinc-cadmium resistance protein CzcA